MSDMIVRTYHRRPLEVQAIQVTEGNLTEVAEWCKGDVRTMSVPDPVALSRTFVKYISVKVKNRRTPRQSQAFPGDWILESTMGFKVYSDRAFKSSFIEGREGEGDRIWGPVLFDVVKEDAHGVFTAKLPPEVVAIVNDTSCGEFSIRGSLGSYTSVGVDVDCSCTRCEAEKFVPVIAGSEIFDFGPVGTDTEPTTGPPSMIKVVEPCGPEVFTSAGTDIESDAF